jgi:soluble lytic murein transglycosylase
MTHRHRISLTIAIAALTLSCGANPFAHLSEETTTPASVQPSAAVERVSSILDTLHTSLSPEERLRTAKAVVEAAERTGLPEDLVLAVIQVESSGNAFAVSHVGAMGLMQLLPGTAEEVADRLGIVWTGDSMLFDPVINVRLGSEYLRWLIERYDDVATGLAAYNWGPTRIARKMQRGEAVPAAYADRVLQKYTGPTAAI